jgi:crossover junction endodeoxyribonuclease RusA
VARAVTTAPLLIMVKGEPRPQGSKTGQPIRKGNACPVCKQRRVVGVTVREVTGERLTVWRDAVKAAGLAAMAARGLAPITGPVVVAMTFTLKRPDKHYRTGRYAHLLKDDAPEYPDYRGIGDAEKYARAAADALTDGGVWLEDCQVIDYVRCAKVWPWPDMIARGTAGLEPIDPAALAGEPDADRLPHPGAVIRITRPRDWLPAPPQPTLMDQPHAFEIVRTGQ